MENRDVFERFMKIFNEGQDKYELESDAIGQEIKFHLYPKNSNGYVCPIDSFESLIGFIIYKRYGFMKTLANEQIKVGYQDVLKMGQNEYNLSDGLLVSFVLADDKWQWLREELDLQEDV